MRVCARVQKVRQTWVLRHLYDEAQVDASLFKIVLRYIKPLTGAVREVRPN